MIASLVSTLTLKLLTEKVIIEVALQLLNWLVHRTSNKFDDKLLAIVDSALRGEVQEECQKKSNNSVPQKRKGNKVSSGVQKTGKD